jgi:EAL domain-containing protein (putative c-di-GMP-specific phosphodiesterase class I)
VIDDSLDPPSRLRVIPLHDRSGLLERIESHPETIRPRFAPLADLRRGVCAGYEVLLSIDGGEALSPRRWADELHSTSVGQAEAALTAVALAERERLPAGAQLLINVSAAGLRSQELRDVLANAGAIDSVTIMVTEDAAEDEGDRVALEAIREAGGHIGVDETGSGYASLRHVLDLRPEFVRIGEDFIAGIDGDAAKGAIVEALISLAGRMAAQVIAGGIPGRPELSALRRMGVPLGQGPLFGTPGAVMAPLAPVVADAIRCASPPVEAAETVAALIEARPALPWGTSLEEVADAFLEDPLNDVIVLVDERSRPLALAERAALLRGEPYERPIMRISPTSPQKAVARRAAARPWLERFHPLIACDRRGVYLGLVRVEQLLDAIAQGD